MRYLSRSVFVLLSMLLISACSTTGVPNPGGQDSKYENVSSRSTSSSVGIESNDIVTMTEKMVRKMSNNPNLMNRDVPPRVLVDSSEFVNESTSRIDVDLITSRLRIGLNNAANGKLLFVSRKSIDRIMKERELKRVRVVDGGTIRTTDGTAAIDFFLEGKIGSSDTRSSNGQVTRYTQITFEMIDAEYGTVVFGDFHEFKKSAADDAVYR